jgi:tetratricopeptide (TPR) repeat protein
MAFNKARALQEAESLASQGKISQAIDRYFRILDKDSSELILLNTIGDLYVRDKNVAEGLKQFYKLAEAYVHNGYALKAIAIYKKIVKLEPDSVGPLLKAGELYQAQRMVRETRDLYYQVAEFYKKRKQNDKALETLRKIVQLDPENAGARSRLAAFCEELGRKDDALEVYVESAQLALRREDSAAAEVALKKAQELNPDAPQIQLLRAQLAFALKHPEETEAILNSTPGLRGDPAARTLLVESYVALREIKKAEILALELFRAKPPDIPPLACFVSACVEAGQFDAASETLSLVANELIAQGNTSALMESLRLIRRKSPQHLPALELIYRICDQSGDVNALVEILEALGHAYLQCGQFEKARQAFQKLIDHDPGNEHYDVLRKDVIQKQGEKFGQAPLADLPSAIDLTAEETSLPPASPVPATDRAGMVRDALENSELFARYHLLSRAVAELERVLEAYPDEIEIHKRLVGMCWKDLPERAEQAAQALAVIYAQQGDTEGAQRFAQMAGEPETVAGLAARTAALQAPAEIPEPEPLPPTPAQPAPSPPGDTSLTYDFSPAPGQEGQQNSLDPHLSPDSQASPPAFPEPALDLAMPVPDTSPSASYSEIQMVDLSQDLEAFLAAKRAEAEAPESPQQAPAFNFDDSRVEISFYLEQGFFEEARGAVESLEATFRGDPRITELRSLVEAYTAGGPSKAPPKPDAAQERATARVTRPGAQAVDQREAASRPAAPRPEGQPAFALSALPGEEMRQLELPTGMGAETATYFPSEVTEAVEPAMAQPAAPLPAPPSSPQPPVIPSESSDIAPPSARADELREGSRSVPNDNVPEFGRDENAEAHFNLGMAFWEMKLLDQAIGEFQKAVNGAEKTPQPANYLQACSLLAACFMQKDMAPIAVKWYCRALGTTLLDKEARLALQYDLGVAYERAGDLPHAIEMFSDVYGKKIDFRDVAEKIRALQQKGS